MTPKRVALADIELAVVDEGSGPPVVLLHGFPDSAWTWRHQIAALTAAGFRTIAPDLRGFGESDKPGDVEGYRISNVARDVLRLLDLLEIERVRLVGHDWGAYTAWFIAALHPQRVERLAVLSVGHPGASRERTIAHREMAWYMLLFQFPDVAEELLTRDGWRLFREWTRGDGDTDRAIADLSRPGALTAALNYYRANAHPRRELGSGPVMPAVVAPTLGLWGSRDHYLPEAPMQRSKAFVNGTWRYERVEGASHWIQVDAPERVNALLLEFFSEAET